METIFEDIGVKLRQIWFSLPGNGRKSAFGKYMVGPRSAQGPILGHTFYFILKLLMLGHIQFTPTTQWKIREFY